MLGLAGLLWAGCCLATTAALLPRNPGYALSVNARTNTEYAYSYPRRLYAAFTVEMWLRGYAESTASFSPFSVAHPADDNVLTVSDSVKLLNVEVLKTPPCPAFSWCHLALAVDLTAYPTYSMQTYVNGQLVGNATGVFTQGLTPADIEVETLTFVVGQEQDSQLGTFDPTQIFSGLLDEVRVWNATRTAAQIQADYFLSLTPPFPADLVSYYTFDAGGWDDTYYPDLVNASEGHRFYVADTANATTAASVPPAYAPPVAPLPRLALSSAPVCAVDKTGRLAVRVAPTGTATVPVASLYCGGPAVSATVTAVAGGTVSAEGRPALGVSLGNTQVITFTASSGVFGAGAGFNFTASAGPTSVSGLVEVLPNRAPTIAAQMGFVGDEDVVVRSWIAATDDDRDLVSVLVVGPPLQGTALMDGIINRTMRYTPPANANGFNVGVFWLQAVDTWGAVSTLMLVNVSLKPVTDAPQMAVDPTFTIYRGQRVAIPFRAVDVDGTDPFVIVSDWPAATQGYLEGQDSGRTWSVNDLSMSSKFEWASGFANYSSQLYPGDPYNEFYGIWRLLGPPDCLNGYEDCYAAWSPETEHGGCVNRATPDEALYTFYTEFFEVKFATPVYLTNVIVVENFGGDRIARVRVPSDRDPAAWKTIMQRDIADTPASPSAQKYSVSSLEVCQSLWPVDRVRVEADTCHRNQYYEVDAVQIRGAVVASKNVLNTTAQLYFHATPGYAGNATFGLTATSCYGSYEATSEPVTVTVQIVDTPHVITAGVGDGWTAFDVGQMDAGPRGGGVLVLELPGRGTLRYKGIVLEATLEDLGSDFTVFEYQPFRCTATLTDVFSVQVVPLSQAAWPRPQPPRPAVPAGAGGAGPGASPRQGGGHFPRDCAFPRVRRVLRTEVPAEHAQGPGGPQEAAAGAVQAVARAMPGGNGPAGEQQPGQAGASSDGPGREPSPHHHKAALKFLEQSYHRRHAPRLGLPSTPSRAFQAHQQSSWPSQVYAAGVNVLPVTPQKFSPLASPKSPPSCFQGCKRSIACTSHSTCSKGKQRQIGRSV
eukprot:EG_transcript_1312